MKYEPDKSFVRSFHVQAVSRQIVIQIGRDKRQKASEVKPEHFFLSDKLNLLSEFYILT